MSLLTIIKDQELNLKHKIIACMFLNNTTLITQFFNIYIKVKSLFVNQIDKSFRITKENECHYKVKVSDNAKNINTATVYRALNLSRGLEWRINYLANRYGVEHFNIKFNENDNIIDIGANIGEFSMYASRFGANVFAVEHDKFVFQMLKKNFENFDNAKLINKSIADKSEDNKKIYYNTLSGSSTIIEPLKNNLKNFKNVNYEKQRPENLSIGETSYIALDDIIEKYSLKKVKMIKSDCEGAEPEMLDGLNKYSNLVEYISIDCGPERNGEWTTNQVIEKLKEKNFFIISSDDVSWKRSTIIAKNKNII